MTSRAARSDITSVSRSRNELKGAVGKQIEAALEECEKKFLNALRECPLAVTLTSAIDHRYIEVNDTFERMSGWSRNEIIGRTPFDIDIWVDPSQRVTFVKHLLAGGTVRNLDVRARLKNREVWIGVETRPSQLDRAKPLPEKVAPSRVGRDLPADACDFFRKSRQCIPSRNKRGSSGCRLPGRPCADLRTRRRRSG